MCNPDFIISMVQTLLNSVDAFVVSILKLVEEPPYNLDIERLIPLSRDTDCNLHPVALEYKLVVEFL